jgi:integrase
MNGCFKLKENKWATRKWFVEGRENGKRTRKFFATKGEAQTYRDLKNNELLNRGIEHAEFPTALRVMAQNAAERLKPFGQTIADAVDYYVAHLQASAKSCTAAQLVDELLKAKKADGVGARHLRDIRIRLGKFAEKFNGQTVATITSKEIDDWLRSIPFSPLTRNHYRALVVLAFNFAVRSGYTAANPAIGAARAKVRSEAPGILTVSETARLLEAATPDVLPYIAIGLFAGLRRAEIKRLDWSEIDFESNLIEVKSEKSKTGQRRLVTLQPNLREWLLPVRERKGNVTPPRFEFRRSFKQARQAAAITDWPENALRHSFASYHLAKFNDAALTALQLGHHDSRVTFAHYRELVKPREAERYWSIRPVTTANVVTMQRSAAAS